MGDCFFLKIFLYKRSMRYGKRGKLSPCFVGIFEIQECVGPMTYRIAWPPKFIGLHDIFHISMLKKYHHDRFYIISYRRLLVRLDMSYAEYPVEILDREEKVLRNRRIPMVKVMWQYHSPEGATSELEDKIWKKHSKIF